MTAPEVDGAPTADHASGVVVPADSPPGEGSRTLARVLLLPPRMVVGAVLAGPRLAAWTWERYAIRGRIESTFFDDTLTYGAYPTLAVESGFGASFGAIALHRDLFGEDEELNLSATYGGRFSQDYELSFETGDRFGPVELELNGGYEALPKSSFYGYGNADLSSADDVTAPVDPTTSTLAVKTRSGEELARGILEVDVEIVEGLEVAPAISLARREYGESDRLDGVAYTPDVYDPMAIPGFTGAQTIAYGQLAVELDLTEPAHPWLSRATPSRGWFASVYAGHGEDPDGDAAFNRFGGDIQRLFDLFAGDRVLALRAQMEVVTGDRDRIPFYELPRLGGPEILRGYVRDRFRDRVATLASAEYRYGLDYGALVYFFGDAGRVFPGLDDLEWRDVRFGYGAGLQIHTSKEVRARGQVALSTTGDVFFQLLFDRAFSSDQPMGRK